jgi:hypothetical protein
LEAIFGNERVLLMERMNEWVEERKTRGELKLKSCQEGGEEEEARRECPIFVLFLFLS